MPSTYGHSNNDAGFPGARTLRLRARAKHLATAAAHVLAVLAWLVTDEGDDDPKQRGC